ncbi:hypothetical protein FSARC_8199 [Fusarium sarcochroum]|uniref:Uncharacterized protein n=1 Tax=Fusarium sarcochroum TaxID=1208366 RepID=A0A8H4TTX0_9HYPO|nr:hypothetical protein FSARC_8199 [Fusarium sarcochroum]
MLLQKTDKRSSQVEPPDRPPIPIFELPPRRIVVWIWVCSTTERMFGQQETHTPESGEHYELDEWRKSFGKEVKIITSHENEAFLDVLRDTGYEIAEISAFMSPYPTSPRWESRISLVEGFCQGADLILKYFVPDAPDKSRLKDTQEPKAWISDFNLSSHGVVPSRHLYGRILNNNGLYSALLQKRFSEDLPAKIDANTRRIYVNNPNGVSILVLLRTATPSQVYGFRELFASYLTPSPVPELALRHPDWWNGASFVIAFNLPFLAIGTESRSDTRTFSDNQYLRARHDLEFLNLKDQPPAQDRQDATYDHDNIVLHEAVYSFMITGRSELYWTAVCLDDDFFDEESRLADEEEIEHLDGIADPITFQAELERTRSPRAYSLIALGKELEKIVEYHKNTQERLKESLDFYTTFPRDDSLDASLQQRMHEWRKQFPNVLEKAIHFNSRLAAKVSHFLTDDVMVGPDEVPHGPLWRGLQPDSGAFRSLRSVKNYCGQLRDIGLDLEQLRDISDRIRREEASREVSSVSSSFNMITRIAIAAFVLQALSLIAQVYASKPDKDDSSSQPGYLALIIVFIIAGVLGTLWLHE